MPQVYIIKPATTMEMFGEGELLFLARIPARRKTVTTCSLVKRILTFLLTILGALITYAQIHHRAASSSPSMRERCGAIEVSCPLNESAAIIFQYAALLGISSLNNKRPKFNCADGYEWLRTHFQAASFDADVQVMHTEKFDAAKDQCCRFNEGLLNLKCERSATIRHSLRSFLYFQDQRDKMRRELAPKNLNNRCEQSATMATDKEELDGCVRIGIYMPWRHPPNESNIQMEAHFLGKAIDHFRTYHNGSCARFIAITDEQTYTSHNLDLANISIKAIASPSEKLCLLSRMSGLIISGEGLSWWAAYLCNGRILYPSFLCPEDMCSWKEFYFPPEWIQI
ncbi:hypothetical protein M514_04088 [Trichuris suis]|uniref:L-Fucosyltransferase n=1 Tax=Trichuris suis TaxID=68888 RepID=A0A085NFY9_9BILA|nr:hypothetical protein M513_04088 [Trichuris suis]KFD68385.1 hypothetical protein M514_04088 [Trichuris suis]KHJ47713.1 hypothetical protein D918_01870 [Trichuris suis]